MNLITVKKDWKNNKSLYFMVLPVVVFFLVFSYFPMAGLIMAFQNYTIKGGLFGSQWVWFKNFSDFFNSYYCLRIIRNTFLISFYDIIFSFPAPIIFALLLNELKHLRFKKIVQTISYMPYFISLVVISGIIIEFFSSTGAMTMTISRLGGPSGNLIGNAEFFRSIFVGSNVWQYLGFNSIIVMATLANIDPTLYEAAALDGAGRWKQMLYITLPGLTSIIIIMLILRLGNLMTISFEKIILLYSPATYATGDVIMSFTYRKGLQEFNYGYSTAVGLFNSVINFVILISANKLCKRFSGTSLF